jgi:aerobic carbon-monoxide dehydrogenase large subunit
MTRVEDDALLRGADLYSGDLRVDGMTHAAFIRSTVAHARIVSVDVSEAVASPGVVAVFVGKDLDVGPVVIPAMMRLIPEAFVPPSTATEVTRYVGEILGVIVADTPAQAADALESVVVDYDVLPAVADVRLAAAEDAPIIFSEFGSNVAVDLPFEAGAPLAEDVVTVQVRTTNHRMAVAPMEPNAVTAVPDPATGRVTAWVATQMPHALREITGSAIGMEPSDLRVIAPAVGGSFGGKVPAEKEYALVIAAAKRLGRPVQFVQSRAENLTTMNGRGSVQHAQLAATRDGRFSSISADLLVDGGAYPGTGIGLTMTTRNLLPNVYRMPHVAARIRGVVTNTAPVGAYRGAGRPEAMAITERLVDRMALELGVDPVELRRRNLIGADEFPYLSLTGWEYDSGNYAACLDEAVRLSGYEQLRAEQAGRRERGDQRAVGIGVAMYVEISAGLEMFWDEHGSAEIDDRGNLTLTIGTSAHGQGHATVYKQIASDTLGLPFERISVVQADTELVPAGTGSGGSSSGQMGGNAVKAATDAVLDKARQLTAHLLEAAVEDVVVVEGVGLGVQGVPRATMSWAELAAAAHDETRRPEGMTAGLVESPGFFQRGGTFPFGCHIAVVEVDLETGAVELVRMVAVDDCGNMLNPMIVEGQVHGGLAAGIGHALFEEVRYDVDGNPLTTSFADYALPSAAEFPSFETAHTVTPSPKNPLGAKGVGEAGTTGSTAAVHNAVVDAVTHLGVDHIELPLTPERVWAAISATR